MGLIGRVIGGASSLTAVGHAVSGIAEVFTQNVTRKMELNEQAYMQAIGQFRQEFATEKSGFFNCLVNSLNRLPRPFLALGTIGLFVYAMVEPRGFGLRMEGLQQVPEPLWWLLGAIVGFYFGAREAHYFRHRSLSTGDKADSVAANEGDFANNAALQDWVRSLNG